MHSEDQTRLPFERDTEYALPSDYEPVRPRHFPVERIILSKGSLSTPERRSFVERICALYPEADRIEQLDVPHNRIDLAETDPLRRHRSGKRTLVFGELGDAVRFSEEEGNTCPNYWHFSPYGYCPYGCKYCYLAGTRGVWFSPTVKIFVNLAEIVAEIDRVAHKLKQPTAFYLGKLQDALALDPLTAYSTVLVRFFARHPFAWQVLLTKSTHVERLLDLDHGGRTILSWSLNPPEIADAFEENVPTVDERISAMLRCAEGGYPVRAVIMPVIPVEGWEDTYTGFIRRLIEAVPLSRLTFGGICIYRGARELMERRISPDNAISKHMRASVRSGDGRLRYPPQLRASFYRLLIEAARHVRPDLDLALCLEEHEVWTILNLEHAIGRCNCVL